MDPNVTLHLIRVELASHREHGDANVDALVHHVQALDDFLTNGGFKPAAWNMHDRRTRPANDKPLVGPEAVEYRTRRLRPVRADDATHPRELPDPADEAAHARATFGGDHLASMNADEIAAIEELLEPVGWDERVVPQRPANEVAARRAAREDA